MKYASLSRLLRLLALGLGLLQGAAHALIVQIDNDVLLDASGTQSPWYSQLGEGWLHLDLETGSSTRFKGTFTDNLDKSASFPASADFSNASVPVLTIQTHTGKFVFQMKSTFGTSASQSAAATSFPKSLGPDASVALAAYPHQANTITYSLHLNNEIGFLGPKSYQTGLIVTLIEDGEGYITPRDPVTKAVSYVLLPGTHPVSTRIVSPGAFLYLDDINEDVTLINFTASVHGRLLSFVGHTTNSGVAYDGNVICTGAGTAAVFGTFHMDKTSGPNPQ